MNHDDERALEAAAEADLTRRQLIGWAGKAGIGAAALGVLGGGALAGCSSSGKKSVDAGGPGTTAAGATTAAPKQGGKALKIGVIAPLSGFAAFVGEVVKGSLDAAQGHIKADLGGSLKGYAPSIKYYDATLPADGQKAYQQAITDKVDAILWCGSAGLVESLGQIGQDQVPVISVFSDIQSYSSASPQIPDLTTAKATGLPIFQQAMPDLYALQTLLTYCKVDRKYDTVGLLFDKDLSPYEDKFFGAIASKVGLKNQGTYSYSALSGTPDFAGPLQKLKDAGINALFGWGLSDSCAAIAKVVNQLGGKYVDTPTALKEKFKPQFLGSPGGTGDASFVRKAGSDAARGTLTAWYIGGVVGLPSFPIRDWIKKYTPSYNGGVIKGGEDSPADGLAIVCTAAEAAKYEPGSGKGADIVKALEGGVQTKFASPVGITFGPTKHLSLSLDDIILVALEYTDPDPGFVLGKEWSDVFVKGYQGPTHLVDFTIENNKKVAPDVIKEVLDNRYGTSCRPEYQGTDQAKIDKCKAQA